MRGQPYTPAVLTAHFWDGDGGLATPLDAVGGFLRTERGTTYRLDAARELRSGSWRLEVTRWPPDEVPPDALIIGWTWTSRKRVAGRARR